MNENTPPPEPHSGQGMDYSEISDEQEVHAAVQREKREPRVGREPLSIWFIAAYGLAVFFGGAYLGRYSGNFSGEALDPYGGEMPTMKKVAGPQGAEQAENSRHAIAERRFLRRIARHAIKRTVSGWQGNIRHWPVQSLQSAAHVARR